MAFQRLQSVFAAHTRLRDKGKPAPPPDALPAGPTSPTAAGTGCALHNHAESPIVGHTSLRAGSKSPHASSLPTGPVSSYQYNFDYITKGASAFVATQGPQPSHSRSMAKSQAPSSASTHGRRASQSNPSTKGAATTSEPPSNAKAACSSSASKGSFGMSGSSYTFSYGTHAATIHSAKSFGSPSSSSTSPVPSQVEEKRMGAESRQHLHEGTHAVTIRPVVSSHSLSALLEAANDERLAKSMRKESHSCSSSSSDSSESSLSSLDSEEDTPPSSTASCAGEPTDKQAEGEEAAAIRVFAFMEAEARRQQEVRRKLLAGILLSRSTGKGRSGSRGPAMGAREAPTKFTERDLAHKRVYVPSSLSSVIVIVGDH